ncbi:MAG: class I SAM-dependent methyltransferase [Oligoflexus sp.]|nr:class I SAM-dependent methyltransferase [Oligoflexus sp.]
MDVFQSGQGVFNNSPEHVYYANPRPEMMNLLPNSAQKILDVGCGSGSFARALKNQKPGREIWGIEINEVVGAEARKNVDKVLVGDIGQLMEDLPAKYFDAVYFNDVLEHLADPYTILSRIGQHLKPDAKILVSLPNARHIRNLFNFIVKKDWEYTDHGVLDRTHLRFFTLKSALRMFDSLGLEVESYQGIVSTGKWFMRPLNWLFFGYFEDTLYLQYAFKVKVRHVD